TMEESIKNFWSPGMLFEELGFRYFGPIDGHNIAQMVQTLEIVKTLKGPRVVHVITEKGKGFPLPQPDTEKYHARAPYDPVTGELRPVKAGPPQWTAVFGEALAQLAGEYPRLVAITAAMPSGTGTGVFQKKWPDRFFDVGIAEAHAVTFAAGLATQGIRPVRRPPRRRWRPFRTAPGSCCARAGSARCSPSAPCASRRWPPPSRSPPMASTSAW